MPTVKLFGNLRRDAKVSQLVVSGSTVRAVLQSLCADNAALSTAIFDGAQLRTHLRVLVNGRDIELAQGLDTPLESQDQIAIFPPIAGGGKCTRHRGHRDHREKIKNLNVPVIFAGRKCDIAKLVVGQPDFDRRLGELMLRHHPIELIEFSI